MTSVEEPFDFEPLLSDAVGLVPMNFGASERAVRQSNSSIPLEFPPTSAAMSFPQDLQAPDAAAGRYDAYIDDVANDFKHRAAPAA
jgi:hypothetical protein